jgi:hypothetical protein
MTTTTVTKTCLFCGKVHRFELDAERVAQWRAGAFVQRCFPEMKPEDRETLISGSCPPCFAAAFPDED